MSEFFSSDIHFSHANISAYSGRPFPHGPEGTDEMNAEIIRRWNSVVGPEDHTTVLGDVAMGKIAESLPLVRELNGRKSLVRGNHDRCWAPGQKKEAKFLKAVKDYQDVGFHLLYNWCRDCFVRDGTNGELGVRVDMCHFPFEGDSEDEDRYQAERPRDEGQWLIHGHVHDMWLQKGRMINVGLDAWGGYPVPVERVIDLIKAGPNEIPRIPW